MLPVKQNRWSRSFFFAASIHAFRAGGRTGEGSRCGHHPEPGRGYGLGLKAAVEIRAREVRDKPSYSGSFVLDEFSPREFMKRLGREKIPTADPTAMDRMKLRTAFSGTADSLELRELEGGLDETSLTGRVAVSRFDPPRLPYPSERIDTSAYGRRSVCTLDRADVKVLTVSGPSWGAISQGSHALDPSLHAELQKCNVAVTDEISSGGDFLVGKPFMIHPQPNRLTCPLFCADNIFSMLATAMRW